MFRQNKETKNKDDIKVMFIGASIALLIFIISSIIPRLEEKRWYRDTLSLTPFYEVKLLYKFTVNEGIMFGGTFKKRRCIFKKISAYILDSNDIYYPVNFKSFQNRGNRPAFKNKQSYGPWVVFNFASHINPKYFEVYVEHENCPSTPINQTNLFLRSKWEDQD